MIVHFRKILIVKKCTDLNWHKFEAMNGKLRLSHLRVFINRNFAQLSWDIELSTRLSFDLMATIYVNDPLKSFYPDLNWKLPLHSATAQLRQCLLSQHNLDLTYSPDCQSHYWLRTAGLHIFPLVPHRVTYCNMGHYKDGSSEYTRNYLSLSDLETPEVLITQSHSQNIILILYIIWRTMTMSESRGRVLM